MAFSAVVFGGLLGVVSTALIVALCACRAAKTIPADRIALEDAYAAACLGLSDGPLPLPRP
nr:hypothetical protein [Caldilineaceae bacterium]